METISLRKAADLAGAGKLRHAARLYEWMVKSADRDGDTALRLGALRRKPHDVDGAIASFERAAELFRRTGHLDKADTTEQLIAEAHVIRCSVHSRGRRGRLSFVL